MICDDYFNGYFNGYELYMITSISNQGSKKYIKVLFRL